MMGGCECDTLQYRSQWKKKEHVMWGVIRRDGWL